MNGAESLVRTLIDSGIDLCITNPGTSEMHFVAALDKVPGMRCVLGLFEGVVTGAADGFYRMADRPAATLLHLGPGLANGLANLHNAKKARSGIVNIVGEHATFHLAHDAPLTSDVAAVAQPMSDWVRTSNSSGEVAADGALAVEAARTAPGRIATLILPADTAWNEGGEVQRARAAAPPAAVGDASLRAAAQALRGPGPQCAAAGRRRRARGCAAVGRPHRREDRLCRAQRVQQPAPAAGCRPGRHAACALCRRQGSGLVEGPARHRAGRRETSCRLLCLSGQAQPAGAAGLPFHPLGRGGRRHRRRAGRAGRRTRARAPWRRR